MRYAAVLIDAGRVLIHPDDALFQQVARSVGCTLPAGVATRGIGRTVWEGARSSDPVAFWNGADKIDAWARHAGLPASLGREVWHRVHHLDRTGTLLWSQVDPGAAAALRRCAEIGLPVAVVSNNDGRLEQQLAAAGFLGLVTVAVDSATAGLAKPAPAIFAHAAARLGVQLSDCVMIGDDPYFDIRASLRAGVASAVLIDPAGDRPATWPTEAYPSVGPAVQAISAAGG